jgi:hypothetical protein
VRWWARGKLNVRGGFKSLARLKLTHMELVCWFFAAYHDRSSRTHGITLSSPRTYKALQCWRFSLCPQQSIFLDDDCYALTTLKNEQRATRKAVYDHSEMATIHCCQVDDHWQR